jgi:deoxyribodipyrimidine photo-lyase
MPPQREAASLDGLVPGSTPSHGRAEPAVSAKPNASAKPYAGFTREELASQFAAEFPAAAKRDAHVSPIEGGRAAAEARLDQSDPSGYAFSRNYLNGKVSRLSPYIRHGVMTLAEAREFAFERAAHPHHVSKFITELAWRDYYQRLYAQLGDAIWQDREDYKTGFPAAAYQRELPPDISAAETGLGCMDAFARELSVTGYLHNHARMWMAAYVVHWRRARWQAGSLWFLSHLLDGDPASNNLSWQWVASTFSHKPYFFNRENLEKYTGGQYCRGCSRRDSGCPFEGTYEQLADKLFRIEVRAE